MRTGWQLIDNKYEYFDASGAWDPQSSQELEPVLGESKFSRSASSSSNPSDIINQMVSIYTESGHAYPSSDLTLGGAPDIETFCTILYEEATDEGIKPTLLFSQVMTETGWLSFGGQVSITQFNFGGIGAVDGGATGAAFDSVRIGIRAQVQHLKAYAVSGITKENLAHSCVDPRFDFVRKGSAPYIQWLGIQENPDHTGWASARGYGIALVQMMHRYF